MSAVADDRVETSAEEEAPSLIDAAHLAWAARAELDLAAAIQSLRTQLRQKLKIKQDAYEVFTDLFEDEVEPRMRIGVQIDGATFCLDKQRALAVVNWECQAKNCTVVARAPITDLVTLGQALARGEHYATVQPNCDRHTRA